MIPRILAIAALAAVAAACGSVEQTAQKSPTQAAQCRPAVVRITVMNGDTHLPVKNARVSVANQLSKVDGKGRAWAELKCRRSLPVHITAKGYLPKLARPPFKKRKKVVVRVYRKSLQWTMYGATPQRTQAQQHIAVDL